MPDTELATQQTALVPTSFDVMPVINIDEAKKRYAAITEFIGGCMTHDLDFGVIPGTGDRSVLFLPGAQKLAVLFGLKPSYDVKSDEDWTGIHHGGEPFIAYQVRCILSSRRDGSIAGEGIGSVNSWESRYRWRWVKEFDVPAHMDKAHLNKKGGRISEPAFAIDKAQTTGQYGKPAEYWQQFTDAISSGTAMSIDKKMGQKSYPGWEIDGTLYRIPNPDIMDLPNTILKVGAKRAFVAAVITAVGISDVYTQDEDNPELAEKLESAKRTQAQSQAASHSADPDAIDAQYTDESAPASQNPQPNTAAAQRGASRGQRTAPPRQQPSSDDIDIQTRRNGIIAKMKQIDDVTRNSILDDMAEKFGERDIRYVNPRSFLWLDDEIKRTLGQDRLAPAQASQPTAPAASSSPAAQTCSSCGDPITKPEQMFSINKFGVALCRRCQADHKTGNESQPANDHPAKTQDQLAQMGDDARQRIADREAQGELVDPFADESEEDPFADL